MMLARKSPGRGGRVAGAVLVSFAAIGAGFAAWATQPPAPPQMVALETPEADGKAPRTALEERTYALNPSPQLPPPAVRSATESPPVARSTPESPLARIEQTTHELNTQLSAANAEYAENSARLHNFNAQIQAGRDIDTITEALNSTNISALRLKQADLNVRKADVERKYGPQHPEYQRVQVESADIKRQVNAELARIRSSLEGEVLIAREKVDATKANLDRVKQDMRKLEDADKTKQQALASEKPGYYVATIVCDQWAMKYSSDRTVKWSMFAPTGPVVLKVDADGKAAVQTPLTFPADLYPANADDSRARITLEPDSISVRRLRPDFIENLTFTDLSGAAPQLKWQRIRIDGADADVQEVFISAGCRK